MKRRVHSGHMACFSISGTVSNQYIGPSLHLSSHFKRTGKPHHLSFCLRLPHCVLQVSELSSELDTKQQEVASLQRSLTAAQQEKDTVEQTLASLVRAQDDRLPDALQTSVSLWLNTLESSVFGER